MLEFNGRTKGYKLMESRLGSILILVEQSGNIEFLNRILSKHSNLIIGRQGIPLRNKNLSVISLIIEGSTDDIGALTGQLGRLSGIQVKSVLMKPLPFNI